MGGGGGQIVYESGLIWPLVDFDKRKVLSEKNGCVLAN